MATQIETEEMCGQRKPALKKNTIYTCPVCKRDSPSNASWNQCNHCHSEYQNYLLKAMEETRKQE